ncbi:MAG: Gfo/Idh/MocA family oxidoreductase [Actinomycetales bacterium]|nr:Gfo/Idh/MocA family oxidoreductase [Actinomycetales bacterium]
MGLIRSRDVHWGVLGAGWLVQEATAEAIHHATGARLAAVASRSHARAESVGADRCYDTYASIVEDPAIEAVYICLHNDAHLPWIQACIANGKHVLCEKPMVLTQPQAAMVFQQASEAGVHLVEAAWTRWHPRMRRIVDLVTSGAIGDITSYLGTFTFDGVPAGNYRLMAKHGGGALYDIGIYPLHGLFACLPQIDSVRVDEVAYEMGGVDVDMTTKAMLSWGTSATATIAASMAMPESQRLTIKGTHGTIRVTDDQAWASWRTATTLTIDDRVEEFPRVDAYQLMFEQVSSAIRGTGGWLLPPRDSLRVAGAVDLLLPPDYPALA